MARLAERAGDGRAGDARAGDDHADEIVIPALLRAARGSYGRAIMQRLSAAGYDDVPRNGSYVLGGMVNHGGSAGDLVRHLGVSKQAASQLIDTLVVRGYLERKVDDADRRRVVVTVTKRGEGAAQAIDAGVQWVDSQLASMISPDELAGLRAGLTALMDVNDHLSQEQAAGLR